MTEIIVENLAEEFMERAAASWAKAGMPEPHLANAAIVWGLSRATAGQGHVEVAEGLQRMADAIHEAAPVNPKSMI